MPTYDKSSTAEQPQLPGRQSLFLALSSTAFMWFHIDKGMGQILNRNKSAEFHFAGKWCHSGSDLRRSCCFPLPDGVQKVVSVSHWSPASEVLLISYRWRDKNNQTTAKKPTQNPPDTTALQSPLYFFFLRGIRKWKLMVTLHGSVFLLLIRIHLWSTHRRYHLTIPFFSSFSLQLQEAGFPPYYIRRRGCICSSAISDLLAQSGFWSQALFPDLFL